MSEIEYDAAGNQIKVEVLATSKPVQVKVVYQDDSKVLIVYPDGSEMALSKGDFEAKFDLV